MIFSPYNFDILLLSSEFFFIFASVLSLGVYTLLEKAMRRIFQEVSLFYSVSIYFLCLLNIYLISALSYIEVGYYLFNYSLLNVYGVDIFKIILVIFVILIFYVGISEQSGYQRKYISFEYNYILGFAFIGMLFMLYSFDFLMMFLSLELQNFSLYILINIQRNKKVVVETCIKYYILGVYLRV